METNRPFVMCVSGLDPSGGAGLLADIKTFEMHRVQGLGICSAVTFQNEDVFVGMDWLSESNIFKQVDALLDAYKPAAVKIGIIENVSLLSKLVEQLKAKLPCIQIVWDPILEASAGYRFHEKVDKQKLFSVLNDIDLITPNLPECQLLFGTVSPVEIMKLSNCSVLIKGGHSVGDFAADQLIFEGKEITFEHPKKTGFSKHGTGCILSSAITSNLAKGKTIPEACKNAKEYIQPILVSNSTRLAYHYE